MCTRDAWHLIALGPQAALHPQESQPLMPYISRTCDITLLIIDSIYWQNLILPKFDKSNGCKISIISIVDPTCNKYYNLISQTEVSILHRKSCKATCFFNSDAGRRVIIIIIMMGVACETKSRNIRVSNSKNFPSEKLLLNGLQYHAGIQQYFIGVYIYAYSYLFVLSKQTRGLS